MVQFPRFPPDSLCIQLLVTYDSHMTGSPIRTFTDLCLLAAPRDFSQLATSFLGPWHLGIRPAPFTTYSYNDVYIQLRYKHQHSINLFIKTVFYDSLIKRPFNFFWMFFHRMLFSKNYLVNLI